MATYSEIYQLAADGNLQEKVKVACVVAADAIRQENPATVNHANRLLWAKAVWADPHIAGLQMLWAVLAANVALAASQIRAASDSAILTNVNAAIDVVAG